MRLIFKKIKIFQNKIIKKIFNYLPDENLIKILNKNNLDIISYLKNSRYRNFKLEIIKKYYFLEYFNFKKSFENMREFV